MDNPLTKRQKLIIEDYCRVYGKIYFYRGWQRIIDYWTGFVRTNDYISRKEIGLILRDSEEIDLISVKLIKSL